MSHLNRNLSDRKVSRPQDVVPQIVHQQMVQPQTADREMRYYRFLQRTHVAHVLFQISGKIQTAKMLQRTRQECTKMVMEQKIYGMARLKLSILR